jgi:tetratricopeptide (TPR) repeat protein
MTKRIAFLLLVFSMTVFVANAVAQENTVVKGACKDDSGKPIAGATVELLNLGNNHKTIVKTNPKGEYYTIGTTGGTYKITLSDSTGKVLFFINNVPVRLAVDNVYDFDLAKLKTEATKSGMTAEQQKAYEQAKANNEKIKGTNALLSQAAQQKNAKQYDEAVATMQQAAAQDQTHDVVYGSLADAYLLDKKYPESETAYNKAIELAPPASKSLGTYHSGLALALLRQGKVEPAAAECEKVSQLDPASAAECYYNEGAILTNMGKADDANQAFDKAIAADPTRPDPYYQKGVNLLAKMTIGKDGKPIPAPGTAEAFNKYLELAPNGANAETAKQLLASIGAPVKTSFGTPTKPRK